MTAGLSVAVATRMAEPFVSITLDGPPRGKGRPRTRVIGKFATIYTDTKTRAYEASLAAVGRIAMGGLDPVGDIPLSAKVIAYMPIPVSWPASKKRQALAGDIWPTGKPDMDNIVKMLDALNGIAFSDDAQIINMHSMKIYSDRPRLEIEIYRW